MIFQMAWRNVWRNKTRSLVIILSVAIGLLAGIGVLALYKGMMTSRVRTVIDSEVGHLQLHNPAFTKDYHPAYVLTGGNQLLQKLSVMKEVKYAAQRSITQGMLVTATGSTGVQVNGIEAVLEDKVSGLKQKIVEGKGFLDEKKNEIIIGKKLADKMKLKKGAKLVLTLTDSFDNIVSAAFRVVGIYQSGNAPLDELNVYIPIKHLNELLGIGDSFHELSLILHHDEDLDKVQQTLKKQFPGILVESWKEISPETQLMVKTVDEYSYIIMMIILVALAFGILNTMLMSVLERTKEIGMMVALGTSRIRIFLLVLWETLFLTLAGTPIGLVTAYLLINYYNRHGLDLSGMGKDMMASFGFNPLVYPSFPWERLTAVMLMVTATALVSSILPALKALRMQPVEALRR